MISPLFSHLLLPYLMAMFLAMNMGGSGTAPSFSAAFGANVIRRSAIPGLFGLMVFLGSVIAGKATAKTMGNEIISPELLTFNAVTIILFSVSAALLVSNLIGIPQSTVQATVMAVVAPAVYFHHLNTEMLFYHIIPAWFILPIISFFICFLAGKYIYKPMRKRGFTISRKVNDSRPLKFLIVLMSMYVAFSIGSNNVANASGPIASMTINELGISPNHANYKLIIILATLIVAPSFGIGSSILGNKVLKNTGKEIVLFGRIEAVIIAFVSASLLLFAAIVKGIPTSLVQINVGAILGIGVAKLGFKNIFRKTEVNRFFAMWLIAPLLAFLLSLTLIYFADKLGLL